MASPVSGSFRDSSEHLLTASPLAFFAYVLQAKEEKNKVGILCQDDQICSDRHPESQRESK